MSVVRSSFVAATLSCAAVALWLTPAVGASQPPAKPTAAKPAEAKPTTASAAVAAKPTGVSAADRRAIVALFKGVDPSKYRIEFGGKVAAGKRDVSMVELEQVRRVTNPAEAAGYVVLAVRDDGVMFVLAVTGGKDLVDVLGAEKAAQLNKIMAKYGPAAGR